jgi:hypothetical protein
MNNKNSYILDFVKEALSTFLNNRLDKEKYKGNIYELEFGSNPFPGLTVEYAPKRIQKILSDDGKQPGKIVEITNISKLVVTRKLIEFICDITVPVTTKRILKWVAYVSIDYKSHEEDEDVREIYIKFADINDNELIEKYEKQWLSQWGKEGYYCEKALLAMDTENSNNSDMDILEDVKKFINPTQFAGKLKKKRVITK